ncbi:RluA family pseudouridine synthase [Salinispira pacifica]|uniref:Ribosomal large subunit pseudouridine synthase D n=1 Tax=Salinispira pacifica TaxID=1307761 RepID=V5WJC4_9SPIO|nr:RluA family pseudouridine synthase [Salinispira pacifica]AHC15266.1 Ribosomal large subunit pseudouridine synthase D [Salinispira pacifica]
MSRPDSIRFETRVEQDASRLDSLASREFELFNRSQFKQRVLQAYLNGKKAKASSSVKAGDLLCIDYLPEVQVSLEPQAMELNVIFENADVLVVNKPRGLVVHPGAGNPDGTLVNGFLHHCLHGSRLGPTQINSAQSNSDPINNPQSNSNQMKSSPGGEKSGPPGSAGDGEFRPGIVHRLDKDTSGVIILAKNSSALEHLSSQFRNRETRKQYTAIVEGVFSGPLQGDIKGYIRRRDRQRILFCHDDSQGKAAHTSYRVLDQNRETGTSLVALSPHSGRTHQLRVHMQHIGHPIAGDPLYNRKRYTHPLMLHARSLRILLPGEDTPRLFTADIPEDMIKTSEACGLNIRLAETDR